MNKPSVVLGIIVILLIMFSGCDDQNAEKPANGKSDQVVVNASCSSDYVSSADLGYKKRDDRCEGRITRKVSMPDHELISVTAGTPVAKSSKPSQFTLKFYLPEQSFMDIKVQELEPEEDYLMDQVKPQKNWEHGWREYSWETHPVIERLLLKINQLGVVARLKNSKSSLREKWVSPVVFYENNDLPFNKVSHYLFVFRIYDKAWVDYYIYREGKEGEQLKKKGTLHERAAGNLEINWDSSEELEEGPFKLVLKCEFFGTEGPQTTIEEVHFYHKPTIESKG